MLTDTDITALCEARHDDPFAILGLHTGAGGGYQLRAFIPGAAAISVVDRARKKRGELVARHPAGFFEGPVDAKKPFHYRLRVTWQDGSTVTLEDPYRFPPVLGETDAWLLGEGSHLRPYEILGARWCEMDGVTGTSFAVWAPNASRVAVLGDFNGWDNRRHPMRLRRECGVWEIFLPDVPEGAHYKYEIRAANGHILPLKADPYALQSELRPSTASVVSHLPPAVASSPERQRANALDQPVSIYEVHLASWRRKNDGRDWLNWDELADQLVSYAEWMGFTHLELMPISEHPFDGSWGYQSIGLYSPTARFGDTAGFTRFVERAHAAGIGVLLDWVPAHFPTDAHGLANFDGTHLYEYADPREGFHQDWNTLIYNFGRTEVRNFLIANALYWLERYNVDGLRVDAVASMLYRDYSRKEGEWIPNAQGGRENLEAIAFLKRMNEIVGGERPQAITLAEESTSYPAVSRPTFAGGLGFHYKWNMGWMHDTLQYMARDPIHRKHHHNEMSFGLVYAFSENFVLPLSHDEVVHGKGSLLGKMPGDRWQKFANLRAYYGFMFGHPGKKLLFMGGEFAQEREWNHDQSLDWHLTGDALHAGMQHLVRDLNHFYRSSAALHQRDVEGGGFEWIEHSDAEHSIYSFIRHGHDDVRPVVVVCNFTPTVHRGYRLGVPRSGTYAERINTDSQHYGGSNVGTPLASSQFVPWQGKPDSILIDLPPLATVIFEWQP
ncbi:1,4-alpha-glucan branching protein GlgB [Uliginosibacterium sp. 31-16]|uniref:1,4-alpha-glucan branching protein GlgB n=1 Tax=Uliginosibacterium sp. 31-16 TaxID=3068315 RepID=UPI00273D4903|nr:1,4-alpha-glucan branching protein GlgB [Uliginosibacterium sp. 31-16]MDP5238091.1 1,4-alpha-glucan branching protein GlgB [Uliginosibacterium sp. 31-16]